MSAETSERPEELTRAPLEDVVHGCWDLFDDARREFGDVDSWPDLPAAARAEIVRWFTDTVAISGAPQTLSFDEEERVWTAAQERAAGATHVVLAGPTETPPMSG